MSNPHEQTLQDLVNQITLNQSLLKAYIVEHFEGNISAFARSLESEQLPHRKTVLRWVSGKEGGLPKSAQRLIELAQTLDVDPFMLLDMAPETFKTLCQQSSWSTSWGKYHKTLTFLSDLFSVHRHWPPAKLALGYGEDWHCWDWVHQASQKMNYYYRLNIAPEILYELDAYHKIVETQRHTQTWYLAYRDARTQADTVLPQGDWRPFGICFIRQGKLQLLNTWGEQKEVPFEAGGFNIEFYCGPGSALFRLASLHPFDTFEASSEHEHEPTLRFSFPQ